MLQNRFKDPNKKVGIGDLILSRKDIPVKCFINQTNLKAQKLTFFLYCFF
jgi:hypothetical protein